MKLKYAFDFGGAYLDCAMGCHYAYFSHAIPKLHIDTVRMIIIRYRGIRLIV